MLTFKMPRFGTDLARFDCGAMSNTFHRFLGPSAPQQNGIAIVGAVIQDGPAYPSLSMGGCRTFIR